MPAVGEGVLLVEVQEPEDLSILLEWDGFAIDGSVAGHLGVGFPVALGAVETRARSIDEVARLVHRRGQGGSLLPPEADEFFRLERVAVDGAAQMARGYAIVVVTEGPLTLSVQRGAPVTLDVGATALIPDVVGEVRVEGRGEVIVCRPPQPSHPSRPA
jgi:mannose-6-phosphate isomerase